MNTIANGLIADRFASDARDAKSTADQALLETLREDAQRVVLKSRQRFPAGTPDAMFYMRSGLIAAVSAPAGRRVIVELLYPGAVFAPAMKPVHSAISYEALDETELWKFPISRLSENVSQSGNPAQFVIQRLNLQHLRTQLHVASLVALEGEQRTVAFLLKLACHYGRGSVQVRFSQRLSRSDMADYLALNPDTLSRIMARLVRSKILARSRRGQVTIADVTALGALCPLTEAVLKLHGDVVS